MCIAQRGFNHSLILQQLIQPLCQRLSRWAATAGLCWGLGPRRCPQERESWGWGAAAKPGSTTTTATSWGPAVFACPSPNCQWLRACGKLSWCRGSAGSDLSPSWRQPCPSLLFLLGTRCTGTNQYFPGFGKADKWEADFKIP